MNEGLARYAQAKQIIIARDFCQQIRLAVRVGGPEIAPGSLHAISKHFKSANAALVKDFPDLKAALTPDAPAPDWQEADPTLGFRATQYLAAFAFGINKNATPMASKRAEAEAVEEAAEKFDELLPRTAGMTPNRMPTRGC
ncbi:hypothetical protein ACFQFQ_08660 [Sulfitobacter porphyrae]|uniref:Uncharacterized protein n=1 Tax=Sulfitobacter porphyrae TaxID=1246864 RepID=A0ABW2B1H4_9RHOB